jgi:CHAT domain-containing protein/tetratricopeptide (TPR) repeat protein
MRTAILLLGLLVAPGELRQRAEEVAAAFRAGEVARLMTLWSERSPSKAADRRRVLRLLDDRAAFTVAIGDIDAETGIVSLELRDRTSPQVVLERYELKLALEDGQPRVWSMQSTEAEAAGRIFDATAEQRTRLLATISPTPALARELMLLGREHSEGGEVERGLSAFHAAVDLGERMNDGSIRAAALRGLGLIEIIRGETAAAARYAEESLRVAESSGDQRGVAKALDVLANTDRVLGDYARAETRWARALQIFREIADEPGEAVALKALGTLRSLAADYPGSRTYLEESLRIDQKLNDAVGQSIVLNNLGIDYRLQGANQEALDHFRRALALSRTVADVEGVSYALGNIGNVLNSQGRYIDALDAYQQSLRTEERMGNMEAVTNLLSSIGELYVKVGDYEQGLEYLRKSYARSEKSGYKEGMAIALHNIAEVVALQGHNQRALHHYEKGLALDTELNDRSGMAIDLSDIGQAEAKLGNRVAARRSFKKSFEIAREINARETMIMALGRQAELATQSRQIEAGLDFARRAMAIATEAGLRENIWELHVMLGRLDREAGRLDEARAEVQHAVDVVEELRRGIPGVEMAEQAFESMVVPYQEMVGILVERGDVAGAFEYAERAKGRVLLDVLRNGRPDISKAMTDAEHDRERELLSHLTKLNRDFRDKLTGGESNAEAAAHVSTDLRKARLEYEAFLAGLYAAHPQLRIERGEISPIRAADLDALLAAKAADAVLEFVVTEERTYLFAASQNDLRVYTIAIQQRALEKEVNAFRGLVAARDLTYATAARSLYDRLLRPARAQLRDAKLICIVADGPLWELPFAALQPTANQFVIDHHALFYAPSVTVLREMIAKPRRQNGAIRLLAFGNPVIPNDVASRVHGLYRDVSLAPVPETEREIREIAALYGPQNSRVHVRGEAREEVVKTEAESFDVLHFATHGIFDDQNAMYSRLFLSPSSSAAEDGFLEAREIMRLDLHADLALLSACETARGRVGAGEGLIGMSWAFFVAGCPTSVASQWSVASASTTELMIELHRALRSPDHPSKAEALRRAALKVRAKPAYRHPFYWAAFVVVGDGH